MRTRIASYTLAGALGLSGVAGAALLAPAVSYAATGDSTALAERVSGIKEALAGLVSDGTLTQAQADSVAGTLAEALPGHGGRGGHGGHGGGLALREVAEDLGITAEELQAAQDAGQTLGELADAQSVDRDALVAALVAAGQERLDAAVADERLTQEQADERAAQLEERATAALDEVVHHGRGGRGGPGGRGPGGERPGAATEESTTPSSGTSGTA